eukprot:gene47-68_t
MLLIKSEPSTNSSLGYEQASCQTLPMLALSWRLLPIKTDPLCIAKTCLILMLYTQQATFDQGALSNKELCTIHQTHGIKGYILARLHANIASVEAVKYFFIKIGHTLVPHQVEDINDRGSHVFIKFKHTDDKSAAHKLVNAVLWLPAGEVETLLEHATSPEEHLAGYQVIDQQQGPLGKVQYIEQFPLHACLVVDYLQQELLIPYEPALIRQWDHSKKQLTIQLPPGFLEAVLQQPKGESNERNNLLKKAILLGTRFIMPTATYTFLEEVVEDLLQQYPGEALTDHLLVVPNPKAVIQLQSLLQKRGISSYSPFLITLEAWMVQLSKVQLVPNLELIGLLYQTFQQHHPSHESFERFYSWGEVLLQDFNVIDQCLVDTDQLFANLLAEKTITLTYEHLSDTQKEAIRSFWKSFDQRLSTPQQAFLQLWEILPRIYTQFTNTLYRQGIGYSGLCYRQLHHTLSPALLTNYKRVVTIGLNALYPAEEQFLSWLSQQLPTQFYWDTDAYYMEDTLQEAGYHLRNHQKKSYFQASFKQPFPAHIQTLDHQIRLFEFSTVAAQAEFISTQIEQLVLAKGNTLPLDRMAIVIAHEAMYLPMRYALPRHLQSVNTTLGYPLVHTMSYQLLEQVLDLQVALHQPTCPLGYLPIAQVLTALRHPLVNHQDPTFTAHTRALLAKQTTPYIATHHLATPHGVLQLIFTKLPPEKQPLHYVLEVIMGVQHGLQTAGIALDPLEKEALHTLQTQLAYTQKAIQHLLPTSVTDFLPFFQQFMCNLSLPSLQASSSTAPSIQLLKLEETTCLDFDYVFILGMNEGNLPARTTRGSMIPHNLRKGHGLPTLDQFYTSLDAYFFYRLLQRAQQVTITYLAASAGSNGAQEKSRYLWQLLYESQLSIEQHAVPNAHIAPPVIQPIIIPKTDDLLRQLAAFTVNSGRVQSTLTPSALNIYTSCSLKFYFRYLLKLQAPPQSLLEAPETLRFGNLLHQVMERLYAPLCSQGSTVHMEDVQAIKSRMEEEIHHVFRLALYPYHETTWHGQHIIEKEVMAKVVHQLLTLDEQRTPFQLLGVEVGKTAPLMALFPLENGKQLALSGIIDRIDQQLDTVHIIDYKTGSALTEIAHISDLFNKNNTQPTQAIFQVLLYAWIYKQTLPADHQYKIQPHLINTRDLFDPAFNSNIILQSTTGTKQAIEDIGLYQKAFETGLRELLEELFNPQVSFVQTEDLRYCTTCPYQRICQRTAGRPPFYTQQP